MPLSLGEVNDRIRKVELELDALLRLRMELIRQSDSASPLTPPPAPAAAAAAASAVPVVAIQEECPDSPQHTPSYSSSHPSSHSQTPGSGSLERRDGYGPCPGTPKGESHAQATHAPVSILIQRLAKQHALEHSGRLGSHSLTADSTDLDCQTAHVSEIHLSSKSLATVESTPREIQFSEPPLTSSTSNEPPPIAEISCLNTSYSTIERQWTAIPAPSPVRFGDQLPTFSPGSRVVALLRSATIVAHIFNFFVITLSLAWPCSFISLPIAILNAAADLINMAYWLAYSLQEYHDEYGILNTHPPQILRYRFAHEHIGYQLLGSIPVDMVVLCAAFSMGTTCDVLSSDFNLYKLYAILRLLRIFPMKVMVVYFVECDIPGIRSHFTRLLKNMVLVILTAHVSGCLFWLLAWVYTESLVVDSAGRPVPLEKQYLLSFYWAQRALFFYPRDVTEDAEYVYTIIETLVAAMLYGGVFGNIFSIIKFLDTSTIEYDELAENKYKMKQLSAYMAEKQFPPKMQEDLLQHFDNEFCKNKGIDEKTVFDGLPNTLQQDIANFLYLDLIKNVPLFQNTDPSFTTMLAKCIRPISIMGGQFIFRKGDEATEMYFIRSGDVEICSEDGGIVFCKLGSGQYFGESALVESRTRTASVRAVADPNAFRAVVELCFLTRDAFQHALNMYPDDRAKIAASVEQKHEADKRRRLDEIVRFSTVADPSNKSEDVAGSMSWSVSSEIDEAYSGRESSMFHPTDMNFSGVFRPRRNSSEDPSVPGRRLSTRSSATTEKWQMARILSPTPSMTRK